MISSGVSTKQKAEAILTGTWGVKKQEERKSTKTQNSCGKGKRGFFFFPQNGDLNNHEVCAAV